MAIPYTGGAQRPSMVAPYSTEAEYITMAERCSLDTSVGFVKVLKVAIPFGVEDCWLMFVN